VKRLGGSAPVNLRADAVGGRAEDAGRHGRRGQGRLAAGRPDTCATPGHPGRDADVLRCYCEAVARYAQAAAVRPVGANHPADGNLVKNPLHQVARDNADEVRQFARELGLSPSARVGLRIEPGRALDSLTADIGLPPRLRVVGDVG
jgi:P27 family predicted phage terminase small subunit